MPWEPGESGNPNGARKSKRWEKALERGLARFASGSVDDGLDKVADHVVQAAVNGDKDAWKEIGDRIDGKSVQQTIHSGDADNPLIIQEAHITVIDPTASNAA